MADMMWTTEDGHGNVLAQETFEVADPAPTVEDRLATIEAYVLDPAQDDKTLVDKVAALADALVSKGVLQKGDIDPVKTADAVEDVEP